VWFTVFSIEIKHCIEAAGQTVFKQQASKENKQLLLLCGH
jgi:hypothetical protein